MTTKETKSSIELANMLMDEIRKYPECSQIISVVIRQNRRKICSCNWYAEWILPNKQLKFPLALKITKQFQSQFDLSTQSVIAA
jgi:hypothetical protein